MSNRSDQTDGSGLRKITPDEAFQCIKKCRDQGRRIIPLFGAGISVGAAIPTSNFLADYICAVCAVAKAEGWENNYKSYLRLLGWPHRHDKWLDWLLQSPKELPQSFTSLQIYQGDQIKQHDDRFTKERNDLYQFSLAEELRKIAPLYQRMGDQRFKLLIPSPAGNTDYRSLLLAIADGDSSFTDSFFDHFVRDREPATAHQFIAFLAQLCDWNLILTTNFDALIERALRKEGHQPTVYEITKDSIMPAASLVGRQGIAVVKLHGGTHALRAGYDLDESLPQAALMEIRDYMKPQGPDNAPPPLVDDSRLQRQRPPCHGYRGRPP